jgi:hypothetical protein
LLAAVPQHSQSAAVCPATASLEAYGCTFRLIYVRKRELPLFDPVNSGQFYFLLAQGNEILVYYFSRAPQTASLAGLAV